MIAQGVLTHGLRRGVAALAGSLAASLAGYASADSITLGAQNWPGVTVKTAVAEQIIDATGHEVDVAFYDPQFVYQGIRGEELDATLGAWMPAHEDMLAPILEAGDAVDYAVNLEGAVQGLAVPGYVADMGIESVEDLVANGDAFDREIYAIGAGAAMTEAFDDAVADNYKGLGDWSVRASSTSGMLSQVERAAQNEEPIVFHGWRPHWMDLAFDLHFLTDAPERRVANQVSEVHTIVAPEWPDANPQLARFLNRFYVPADVQSEWIRQLDQEDREADAIARDWIADNLAMVEVWLAGVTTPEGERAIVPVRQAF